MIKAVVFDIDNTLTPGVSWLRITELLGASVTQHENIFHTFLDGQLSYDEAVQQLTNLWLATGNATKAHWRQMFVDWPLQANAHALVRAAADKGYKTALITGSVDLFAATLAERLRIPHWYANAALSWDANGVLATFSYEKNQAAQKLLHLQQFAKQTGISLDECLVVADGDNDVETFKATGRGVAVASTSVELQAVAWKQVGSLSDVIPLLKNL